MKKVNVVVYKMTGRQLFFNVPEKMCKECDLSVAQVKNVANKVNGNAVDIKVKSWLNHVFQGLLKGGWHPPIVTVNGKIFSQGIVPDAKELENKIREETKLNNLNS